MSTGLNGRLLECCNAIFDNITNKQLLTVFLKRSGC